MKNPANKAKEHRVHSNWSKTTKAICQNFSNNQRKRTEIAKQDNPLPMMFTEPLAHYQNRTIRMIDNSIGNASNEQAFEFRLTF